MSVFIGYVNTIIESVSCAIMAIRAGSVCGTDDKADCVAGGDCTGRDILLLDSCHYLITIVFTFP